MQTNDDCTVMKVKPKTIDDCSFNFLHQLNILRVFWEFDKNVNCVDSLLGKERILPGFSSDFAVFQILVFAELQSKQGRVWNHKFD